MHWAFIFYGFHSAVSMVLLGLSIATADNIEDGFDRVTNDLSEVKNGLMAACVLTILSIFFFMIASIVVFVFRKKGDMTLGYGIMMGSSLNIAWVMLLAGLVLQASDDFIAKGFRDNGVWSSNDYNVYVTTFAFNYLMTAMYIALFFILFLAKGAILGDSGPSTGISMSKAPSLPNQGASV